MSKICPICGESCDSGVVVHKECLPHWRPANQPPEEDEAVLVIVNGKYKNITFVDAMEFGSWNSDDGWVLEHYPEWEDPGVRCWMDPDDLPELPEEIRHERT